MGTPTKDSDLDICVIEKDESFKRYKNRQRYFGRKL